MSKRTIRCKLAPTAPMVEALIQTTRAFADGCNAALAVATAKRVSNNIKLHHLVYRQLRQNFGLSANLAVRAVRRVAAAMTRATRGGELPREFRAQSVDYDARIFAFRERDEVASLTVIGGRIHVPLVLGVYQREALRGKTPTAAVLIRERRRWFLNIVVEDADPEPRIGPPMGVDLGLRNTAATSRGTLHDGTARQRFKSERMRVRASLQNKSTPGAKRVLRRLAGSEARRIRHENHVLSRAIVTEAVNAQCGSLRLEKLTGIRQRTRVWNKHGNRMVAGWSFAELQHFLAYKAQRAGLAVEYVNPAYTSQTCATCGVLGSRTGDVFRCNTCGERHADINAAINIANGGVVNRPESRLRCVS